MNSEWLTYLDGSKVFLPEAEVLASLEENLAEYSFKRDNKRFYREHDTRIECYELQSSKSGGYFLNYGVRFKDIPEEYYMSHLMRRVHWGQRSSIARSPGSVYYFFENEGDVDRMAALVVDISEKVERSLGEIRAGVLGGNVVTVMEGLIKAP